MLKMSAVKTTMQNHPLVGMLFHSYDREGVLHFQGKVVSVFDASGKTVAMCQLFSFLDGMPTDVLMYDVGGMIAVLNESHTQFKFYRSEPEWLLAYEKYTDRWRAV